MNKMIKIETLKEALNIYDYEATTGLWNYISGIVSQAESEVCNTFQLANIGTINSRDLFESAASFAKGGFRGGEIYNSSSQKVFLIYNVVGDKVEYELVNSDKMTDDDRRKLPKDVWIKHDGKSVPVVDGMKWNLSIDTDTSPEQKTLALRSVKSWTNEFLHISSRGKVLAFKILSE